MKAIIGIIIGTIIGGILLAIIMTRVGPILSSSSNSGGQNEIPLVKTVTEKNTSPSAYNCFKTTCSMCLMKLRAGNDPVNPDPCVLSPHEQPVQTNSESDYVIQQNAKQFEPEYNHIWEQQKAKAKLSPRKQPVQTNSESDDMIQQRAQENSEEWYDKFLKNQKANR